MSYHHSSSYVIIYILCSIFCLCHHIFFSCHEWWSFTFQCIEDGHVPFHSYLMDIGSEILSWEDHLVRESSCTSLFESISIPLCILRGVHLLIFRVWGGKKKTNEKKHDDDKKEKEKVISECIYVCIQCHSPLSVYIGHWGCFIELVAYESSYVNFQKAFISLCLFR